MVYRFSALSLLSLNIFVFHTVTWWWLPHVIKQKCQRKAIPPCALNDISLKMNRWRASMSSKKLENFGCWNGWLMHLKVWTIACLLWVMYSCKPDEYHFMICIVCVWLKLSLNICHISLFWRECAVSSGKRRDHFARLVLNKYFF